MEYYQEKNYDQAINQLEQAYKLQPNNAELRDMIDALRFTASQLQDIENQFRQSCKEEAEARTDVMAGLWGRSDIDYILENPNSLKDKLDDNDIKKCLSLAHYIKGLRYESQGDNGAANVDYGWAIYYEPNYPVALEKRGRTYLKLGKYDEAINDYKKLYESFDNKKEMYKNQLAGAYFDRAKMHDIKGNSKLAIEDLEHAINYKPEDRGYKELLQIIKEQI
jgi:tetratricopeptide (TPR) repeat protein